MVEAVQAVEGKISLIPGVVRDFDGEAWVIGTLGGRMEIVPGDWVITDAQGRYICKPDVFDLAYEPVK